MSTPVAEIETAVLASISKLSADVEAVLEQELRSESRIVEQAGLHTLFAGGKRLRPALVTLCAQITGQPFSLERANRVAACMEMLHMATLMHDDVIDQSETRRGKSTASAVFGNTAAILTGDVLLAKAMHILAMDGDIDILRKVSSVVVDLAEGEVEELDQRGNINLGRIQHEAILQKKTATFIQVCCELGGHIADATDSEIDALGVFGNNVGMAFQIADDLIDYRSSSEKSGKPRGTDYREGCATLPLLELLRLGDRSCVRNFGAQPQDDEINEVRLAMEACGAFDSCEVAALKYTNSAISALANFKDGTAKEILQSVSYFLLTRQA